MTGLERNADVVHMASYAPLFAHVEGWQWTPDLIWFDNLSSYGTPSYYVQKLFSTNRGTQVLSILQNSKPLTGENGIFASAVFDSNSNEIILKMVNSSSEEKSLDIDLEGIKSVKQGNLLVIKSDDIDCVNSLDKPSAVSPVVQDVSIKGKRFKQLLSADSFSVLRIKISK